MKNRWTVLLDKLSAVALASAVALFMTIGVGVVAEGVAMIAILCFMLGVYISVVTFIVMVYEE